MSGLCSCGAELYSFMKTGNMMVSRKNRSRSSLVLKQCSSPMDNRIKELQFTPPSLTWLCERSDDDAGSMGTGFV